MVVATTIRKVHYSHSHAHRIQVEGNQSRMHRRLAKMERRQGRPNRVQVRQLDGRHWQERGKYQ
jgi:hypothetical protein